MKSWPSLRNVLVIWGILTCAAVIGMVVYLRASPVDDLVMADTLIFQVLVALLLVGSTSVLGLIVFLLLGGICKSRLLGK